MAEIIQFNSFIDASQLRINSNKVKAGLLAPAKEEVEAEVLAEEHSAEPIKRLEDIEKISDWCISHGKYRDNMLFIVGINFGLRVSDLRMLRFCNLINENMTFKETFAVFEKKTRNTRKKKKNRYVTVNQAVREAVTLYLEHTPNVSLSDYMFRSCSNNSFEKNQPLDPTSINRMMKMFKRELDLPMRLSTHSLRKTFGYHQMVMSNNDPRKLILLQKMFGHRSLLQTIDYIGYTEDEIAAAYRSLNLGSKKYNYVANANVVEKEVV